jgi:hypothetical protein
MEAPDELLIHRMRRVALGLTFEVDRIFVGLRTPINETKPLQPWASNNQPARSSSDFARHALRCAADACRLN